MRIEPVKWNKPYFVETEHDGIKRVSESLNFIHFDDWTFNRHIIGHASAGIPYMYDLELAFVKKYSLTPTTLEALAHHTTYSKETIESTMLYLYALNLAQGKSIYKFYNETIFNRELDSKIIVPGSKFHGDSVNTYFSPFKAFVPEDHFPLFSLKTLDFAQKYFKKALENYDQILMEIFGNELENRGKNISLKMGGITSFDLDVNLELEEWREAAYKHHRTLT